MGLSLIRSWWILSWVYMLCRSGKRLGRGLPPLLKTPGRTNRLILPKNTRNNYKMPLLFKPQVLFQPVAFDENTRNNHIIHLLFEAPKRTNRYKKRNDKFLYKSCHHSSLKTKPFCYRTYFPKITSTMFCVLKIEIFLREIQTFLKTVPEGQCRPCLRRHRTSYSEAIEETSTFESAMFHASSDACALTNSRTSFLISNMASARKQYETHTAFTGLCSPLRKSVENVIISQMLPLIVDQ